MGTWPQRVSFDADYIDEDDGLERREVIKAGEEEGSPAILCRDTDETTGGYRRSKRYKVVL